MVPLVVAFPGQGEESGHDVGHHPVDIKGQLISGKKGLRPLHFGDDHRGASR